MRAKLSPRPRLLGMGCLVAMVCLAMAPSVMAQGSPVYIAGTQPDRRPAKAPVITQMKKGDAWYARALTGLSEPYPASFRFLEDQGAWFTPFNHPGMTGRYDLRGWHRAKPSP